MLRSDRDGLPCCRPDQGDRTMPTWTLAAKDLRLLARDTRAVVILLAMPLIFILVLGLALGEGFGQKPDDRLRVSLVDLDTPVIDRDAALAEAAAWLSGPPGPADGLAALLRPAGFAFYAHEAQFPFESWA